MDLKVITYLAATTFVYDSVNGTNSAVLNGNEKATALRSCETKWHIAQET